MVVKDNGLMTWKLLLFCLLAIPHFSSAENHHVTNYISGDLLPQPYVYTINQDVFGYLWIGTGNGLTRYDGYGFRTYTIAESLSGNFITCSHKTKNGVLYGHMNGGLTLYSGNHFTKLPVDMPDKTKITDIEWGLDETILASTYSSGIISIPKNNKTKTIALDPEHAASVSTIKLTNNEKLLIGTDDGLIVNRFDKAGEMVFDQKVKGIPETMISDIVEHTQEQCYYIATQSDGIYVVHENEPGFLVKKIEIDTEHELDGVQSIYIDNEGKLWIATFGQGLFQFQVTDSSKAVLMSHLTKSNGLSSNYVKTIFQDREGIIWSGNYGGGLSKILVKNYSYHLFKKDVIGNAVQAMDCDEKNYWLGTDKGLLKVNQLTGELTESNAEGLPKDKITALFHQEKYVWLGYKQEGVYRFNKLTNSAEKFLIHTGKLENSITTISGNHNQVWVGTRKGACKISMKDNAHIWYSISQGGLPNNFVRFIYQDTKDRTWISTSCNTLSVIENGEIRKIPFPTANLQFVLNAITEDAEGNIWVGTLGNGIFKIEASQLIHLTTENGLFSNYCYSLTSDGKESIWVGHRGGISEVNTKKFHAKAIDKTFDIDEKYHFTVNKACSDNKHSVFMGFNKGILKINDHRITDKSIAPILNITDLRIDDQPISKRDKITLTPGSYKFEISYLGVGLKEPDLMRYEYLLDGYDSHSQVTHETSIKYPHLTTGKYNLIIKAIDGDGVESANQISLKIIIAPPIWKSPWFYVGVISLVFIIVVFAIYGQKETIKKKNRELEDKVNERTAEIVAQKEQIEKQSNLIKETNKDITASIEYASHIQQAIVTPLSDVTRLLPDCFIINKPRDIVSGDFYWAAEKGDKTIFIVADSTGHGVPGAFMSVLGISLLNSIILENNITRPDRILNEMRRSIIRSLRQTAEESLAYDSINMAVCSYDKTSKQLQYAGAYHPLVHIRQGELNFIKPVRQTLGISHHNDSHFTQHELILQEGDCLYMYSDGFQDQFGGEHEKKFTIKRLKQLFLDVSVHKISVQEQMINDALVEWKGSIDQTDDILMLGVKI